MNKPEPVKACANCAFDMGPCWDDCTYPEPQDGQVMPQEFFAPSSMPDRRNGGKHCHHFLSRVTITAEE